MLPIITLQAPAASALATSPEYRTPPSAITAICWPARARATLEIAVTCGTPTPATTRVVQIEPGPIPTLTPSTPCSASATAAAAGPVFPPPPPNFGEFRLLHPTPTTTPHTLPPPL